MNVRREHSSSGSSVSLAHRPSFTPQRLRRGWWRTIPALNSRGRSAALLAVADLSAMAAPLLFVPVADRWVWWSAVLTVVLFANAGLYRPRLQWSALDDLAGLVGRRLTAVAVTGVFLLVFSQSAQLQDFLVPAAWGTVLLVVARALAYLLIRWVRRVGYVSHRTLVVGSGVLAAELVSLLRSNAELGLQPIGYVDDARSPAVEEQGCSWLGSSNDLERVVADHGATVLLVTFGSTRDDRVANLLRSRSALRCDLFVVPRLYEMMSLKGVSDHIGAIPVLRLKGWPRGGVAPLAKRAFDVVASGAALLLLLPVLLACAAAVRTTGPDVIFRQQRVGQNGRLFDLYKFRSMQPEPEDQKGTTWSGHGDPRTTKVGQFLRRTSLDELPQLWNIARGDMTVVGPRPERPAFAEQFSRAYPHYRHRHRVPVGLTGMSQVSGLRGGETSIDLRARYDNYYIENWSLWGDIKVILRTFVAVVHGKGA